MKAFAKKLISGILFLFIVFSLSGCSLFYKTNKAKPAKLPEDSGTPQSEEMSVDEFASLIEGCWVDAEGAILGQGKELCYSYMLYVFREGAYTPGWYPGEWGREAIINSVTKEGSTYLLDLYYPETTDLSGEQVIEEEYGTLTLSLENDRLTFDGKDGVYIRIGSSFDENIADEKIREYKGVLPSGVAASSGSSSDSEPTSTEFVSAPSAPAPAPAAPAKPSMPRISNSISLLNASISSLLNSSSHYVTGPYYSLKTSAQENFFIKNSADIECYQKNSSGTEILGAKGDKVVFYGFYGPSLSSAEVGDLITSSAYSVSPYVSTAVPGYYSGRKLNAYIWQIDNGYMAIIVAPEANKKFYEQSARSVIYTTDLSYLSYINF